MDLRIHRAVGVEPLTPHCIAYWFVSWSSQENHRHSLFIVQRLKLHIRPVNTYFSGVAWLSWRLRAPKIAGAPNSELSCTCSLPLSAQHSQHSDVYRNLQCTARNVVRTAAQCLRTSINREYDVPVNRHCILEESSCRKIRIFPNGILHKNRLLNPQQRPRRVHLPPVSTSAIPDPEVAETSSTSTPPPPAETPAAETPGSTVDSFDANGGSESFAPNPSDTSPREPSYAPAPVPPPQAPQYQNQQPQFQQPGPYVQVQARNPLLYAVVDFLITGLGLMVQGRVGLGLLFLGTNILVSFLLFIPVLGWILFFLVMLPIWIISMAMAFSTAKNWNRQHGIIS